MYLVEDGFTSLSDTAVAEKQLYTAAQHYQPEVKAGAVTGPCWIISDARCYCNADRIVDGPYGCAGQAYAHTFWYDECGSCLLLYLLLGIASTPNNERQ